MKNFEGFRPVLMFKRLGRGPALLAAITLHIALAFALAPFATAFAQSAVSSAANLSADALLEKHAALTGQLAQNAFGRPLVIESFEGNSAVNGNAYAVLDSPFSNVSAAFKSPNRWCEVMILHINTKYCRANSDAIPSLLKVNIGKKTPQDLNDAFALEFSMRLTSPSANHLAVQLNAEKGPLGTSNYRIELQAVPLPDGKTFMHLRYSYGYGMLGRMAMQGYLATIASGKVGFTTLTAGKKPVYVSGMRGTVERNTMRYYLAIEAYLASLAKPQPQQLNARLEHWFDATEQYPLQLHEMDKTSYLTMKKTEYQRQQAGSAS
ncbi:MAG: hypothetical protein H7228_06310 [Polaromonas sp.]|nr:hypothetical protein [Polaromonas sp.]